MWRRIAMAPEALTIMPYPHKFIKLTPDERMLVSNLLRQLAVKGKERERRHVQVLHLSDSGLTFRQIVKRIGEDKMSYRTVRRCISTYLKEGVLSPYFTARTG